MLLYAQHYGLIRGIRASFNGPSINHMFFDNDALLFIRNKKEEVKAFTKILKEFERGIETTNQP